MVDGKGRVRITDFDIASGLAPRREAGWRRRGRGFPQTPGGRDSGVYGARAWERQAVATLDGLHPWFSWCTLGLTVGVIGSWLLVRSGLLAYVTALMVAYLFYTTPMTVSFSSWFAESGVWAAALVLAVATAAALTTSRS